MTLDHDHPFCGGVAISPWNVLTAAHCLFPEKVRYLASNLYRVVHLVESRLVLQSLHIHTYIHL